MSVDEIKEVTGGIPLASKIQLFSAIWEAIAFALRSSIESFDDTRVVTAARVLEKTLGDPRNLSWKRVTMVKSSCKSYICWVE